MKRVNLIVIQAFLLLIACKTDLPTTLSEKTSLKTAYTSSFLIGAAVNEEIVSSENKKLTEIAIKHFNTITPENVMKAELIHPLPNQYNFEPADAVIEFGKQNNQKIIGHTLVWHNQTPDWFFFDDDGNNLPKQTVLSHMKEHIQAVASRYDGKVIAWDVVNEVIDNDGSYRPTKWVNAVGDGDEMVKYAFQYANEFTPNSELYYNDFNAWRPEKRDGIVRMVNMLQNEGIRIDGIGIQGHWGLNYPKIEYIADAIDAYADLGVKVMITELDIDVLPLTKEGQIIGTGLLHPQYELEEFKTFLDPYQNGMTEDLQNQITNRYKELFQLFYEKRDKIDRVTFWGIHDSMSWKNGYPIPNRTNYPLPFNRDLSPKPAVKEIIKIPSAN